MSLVENKKINLNYELKDKFIAGIQLTGNEVKAIRNSSAQIVGSKIIIRGGEAFIVGMSVSQYQQSLKESSFAKASAGQEKTKNDRTRKLLLKKSEILKLATESEKGLSILPIKIFSDHGLLKLELALVKRKNKQDKRETLKKKDFQKEKRKFI